jgi:hypothetical protein
MTNSDSDKPPSLVGEDVQAEMAEVLQSTPRYGDIIEVGVYKGGTLWTLAKHAQGRVVCGYDTFTGIPYSQEGDSHKVGDFADTSMLEVAGAVPDAILVAGVFPDSALAHPNGIAFAHLDCDQYQSVKEASEWLIPRMLPGGVIWFDDGCLQSARNAMTEVFGARIERTRTQKEMVRF